MFYVCIAEFEGLENQREENYTRVELQHSSIEDLTIKNVVLHRLDLCMPSLILVNIIGFDDIQEQGISRQVVVLKSTRIISDQDEMGEKGCG